jgi:hypothetical protein
MSGYAHDNPDDCFCACHTGEYKWPPQEFRPCCPRMGEAFRAAAHVFEPVGESAAVGDDICKTCDGTGADEDGRICKDCGGKVYR